MKTEAFPGSYWLWLRQLYPWLPSYWCLKLWLCLWNWNTLKSNWRHMWETSEPNSWVSLLFQKKGLIQWVDLVSNNCKGGSWIFKAWFCNHTELVQTSAASFIHYLILGKSLPLPRLQFSLFWGGDKLTSQQTAQASPRQPDTWESQGSWQIWETSPAATRRGLARLWTTAAQSRRQSPIRVFR